MHEKGTVEKSDLYKKGTVEKSDLYKKNHTTFSY